jgi:hypothetical protein
VRSLKLCAQLPSLEQKVTLLDRIRVELSTSGVLCVVLVCDEM